MTEAHNKCFYFTMCGVFSRSADVIGASFNRPVCFVRAEVDRSDGLTLLRLDNGPRLVLGLNVTDVLPI